MLTSIVSPGELDCVKKNTKPDMVNGMHIVEVLIACDDFVLTCECVFSLIYFKCKTIISNKNNTYK